MTDEIPNELEVMKKEIDALQIEVMKGKGAWYKSAPVFISVCALVFSFGTTIVSFHKAAREDVRSARAELRGILQRLTSLPRDNFELIRKYKNDPEGLGLSGLVNQENSLLVTQASEIVDRFPDEISASEYFSVAVALINAADVGKVPRYLEHALGKTSNPNIKVAILRNYGTFLIVTGDITEGRRKFEQALSMWRDYPSVTQYFKESTDAQTEMYWSQVEMDANNANSAQEHIQKSLQHLNALPPGPMTMQLQSQILHTQSIIEQGVRAGHQTTR